MHGLTKLSGSNAFTHYNIKPMVETIMDKGMVMQGTYENAKVAKHAVKYGYCVLFNILPRLGLIVLLKKELFKVGRVGTITKFQL